MKTPILFSIANDLHSAKGISDEVVSKVKATSSIAEPKTKEDVITLVWDLVAPFKFESSLNLRDVVNNASTSFIKAKHYSDFSTEDFV